MTDTPRDDTPRDDTTNDDTTNDDSTNGDAPGNAQADELRDATWPTASISELVNLCASQALIGLGLAPSLGEATPEINLPMARYFVDLLAVLHEKTSGNLEQAQHDAIESTLHELRMACVRQSSAVTTDSAEPDSATTSQPLDDSGTSTPRDPAATDEPPDSCGEQ
ncbi:MAG: DUF1844 domain-containing protein [Planctomycetaceae bacterium]